MVEWPTSKFRALLAEPVRNGLYKKAEFHGSGVKVVNMGELFKYPRVGAQEMRRMQLSDNEKRNGLLENGDLLFARRSLTAEGAGKCALVTGLAEETTFESSIIRARPDPASANSEFLFYLFNSPQGIYLLGTILRQVAVSGITGTDLVELEIPCPELPEQRAIASVLSSLDAKIDLLHRQNKTLEAMAKTLFRQWFVEEAEEGWEEYVLTDIASHCKDSVNPGQHPTRLYHHYSLPAYDEGRKPSPELGDTIKSSKYVVPENAVLVSKLNPRFPRVWPVRDKKHEHPISSTEFQVFVPKKDELFGFLYCFLISKPVQDELASAASGTSGSHQRVSPDDIKGLTFQAKSRQQLVDFSKVVDPLLEKIETNKDQVANLMKLRDTLLPKLMSGEVRVEV